MSKYSPRVTAPSKTNKHYYSNENPFFAQTGMPNCTTYAWGRFWEVSGKAPTFLGQPEKWYANAQAKGYKVGQTPKLGAIIVWKKGNVENPKDGTGHVAVVEKIYDNGDFDSSNSQYKGKEFFMQKITKASGYQYAGGFDFLGFIYCGIEFNTASSTSAPKETVVIKAGTKFELKNTPVYTSENGASVGVRSGNYFAWENATTSDKRIRMTNSLGRVGVANQVSFMVEVNDLLATVKLNQLSYPDYGEGKGYHVKKSFKDWKTSKGVFRIWKNAFNTWTKYKADGYHIYDTNGAQLDR